MLSIQNLSKIYGSVEAISNISFGVSKGEVVGFLGPNGAGKSTTMRIICGCIGPTSGQVLIDGLDTLESPIKSKSRIGYLPEIPPLYPNMIVEEYLRFCGQLKGVEDLKKDMSRVVHLCGLEDHTQSFISTLSKGYKQRVGLAQALIHRPDLLVLDEPTSGLDPAQRIEFRQLLRELAKGDITVILSTHILSEIEAICSRVVIISQGKIIAQDDLKNLKSMEKRIRIRVAQTPQDLVHKLEKHPQVNKIFIINDELEVELREDVRADIARLAVDHELLEFRQATTLEDVYLRLTAQGAP